MSKQVIINNIYLHKHGASSLDIQLYSIIFHMLSFTYYAIYQVQISSRWLQKVPPNDHLIQCTIIVSKL